MTTRASERQIAEAITEAHDAGQEHYANVGWREAPLSGEWAGESMPELSREYGINLFDDEQATAFEQGFDDGYQEG